MAVHTILPAVPDHDGYERPLGFIPGDERRMQAVTPYFAENEIIPSPRSTVSTSGRAKSMCSTRMVAGHAIRLRESRACTY